MSAVSWFIEQEIPNTIIVYQPPHNSIKLQRASTDTCLHATQQTSASYYPVQNQLMDLYELVAMLLGSRQVSVLAL